jgi:hypothetical protein
MTKEEKISLPTAQVLDVYMDEKVQQTIPRDEFEQECNTQYSSGNTQFCLL